MVLLTLKTLVSCKVATLSNIDTYGRIFDEVSYPVFVIKDYHFLYANKHFIELFGVKDLFKKRCSQVLTCYGEGSPNCGIRQVNAEKKPYHTLTKIKKGKKFQWLTVEMSPLRDKNGNIEACLGTVNDISNLMDLESEITKSKEDLNAINRIAGSLSHLDLNRLLDEAINSVTKILNVEKGGIYLYENGMLKLKACKGIKKKFYDNVKIRYLNKGPMGFCSKDEEAVCSKNIKNNTINGSPVKDVASCITVPLIAKNKLVGTLTLDCKKNGSFSEHEVNVLFAIAGQIGIAIENARLYKRTKALSRYDQLTGLSNYNYFEEILDKEIKRSNRNKYSFSVLLIDLDNLNSINDFYGHETGDRILKIFAKILKQNLRQSDYIARYAGDEFILLLPETAVYKAKMVAEKIREKTSNINLFGDKKQMITASIGLAVYPTSAMTSSALVKAADLAMCEAKQEGRNQTRIYAPGLVAALGFTEGRIKRFTKETDFTSIRTLVTAVDLKDNYTQQHSLEVSRLSVCLAQALCLSEEELEILRISGLLHDVGKIGIADDILLKPGPLTQLEYKRIKKHPSYGVNILEYCENFKDALTVIEHHHERVDGKGYPHGLKKDEIPYLSKILTVVDAYQAMVSNRPYRESISKKAALAELKHCAGTQFDPEIVNVFLNIHNKIETPARLSTIA